jgi:predicted nuclease of restriction endonuclease-like (RecB) superfamily
MKAKVPNLAPDQTAAFEEVIAIIERSRVNAFRAVNRELISMYWEIGRYISEKVKTSGWGKSIVTEFARFIQREHAELKGFSASNIWRMRQFYETYAGNEKLATVLRELSWSHNLLLIPLKTAEQREFYALSAENNRYSFRELAESGALTADADTENQPPTRKKQP